MSCDRTVLASGCFWGAQELLRKKAGIISTRTGYSGGNTPNPLVILQELDERDERI